MKKPFLIVISLSLFVTSYSQTYQKNFVRKQFPKSAIESVIGVQEAQVIEGDKVDVTTYYDGVNRPIQTVNKEASRHSRDFVSVAEYDEFSRQAKEYLPFSTNENNGNYKNNALIKQADFYETAQKVAHSSYPYANTVYESSPLQRMLKQGFAGYDWQTSSNGHPLSFSYRFNYANEVRKWDENQGDFSSNSFYPANSLSVTIQNDETRAENGDGLQTIVFTDTRGRKIMKLVKRYYEQSSESYVTYYCYDDFGKLKCIIPPKAYQEMQTSGTYNTSSLQDDLLFKYEYDKKKRLIKKKVPGVAEEYLFYDKKGRLVLTQDGILRQADKWRFIKYNTQGQVILTGIYFDDQHDEFAEMQSYIDGFVDNQSTFFYEYYTGIDQSNFHGYSNQSFPTLDANDRILSIKYYSDYAFDVNSEYEFSDFANDLHLVPFYRIDNKLTASKNKILDNTTDEWITEVFYYDKKERMIRQIQDLEFEGNAYTAHTDHEYDFSGELMRKKMYNTSVISGTTEDHTIEWHYYYDHAGRLLSVENQVDEQGLFEMFSYKYNELGQVIEKNIHKANELEYLQSVDYKYNIRGWLTNINQSNLQNDNSIIQLDQELEPDEKVYGIKFDTIYLDTEYEPGDTVTGDNVHYAFTESKRLLVCNINDTSITREISLNETAVFTFNEYRTDSLKFIRLKELTNDDFYILFHATAFDAFQSQSYIIDSLLKIVNIDLNNQGVSDENVREQALDEFRTFAQQRIGIIYFNEDSDDLFGMDLLYNEGFDELDGTPQYNGNISGIKWQVGRTERIERGYGFQYTGKNWLADASYGERDDMNWNKNMGRYNVYDLDYDKNGNITQLKRKGWYNDEKGYEYRNIDLLSYTYNGNQLQAVEDDVSGNLTTNDFRDHGSHSGTEYTYDVIGRLLTDDNKHITNIQYNYLNLPEQINFGDTARIVYLYDAAGRKISKKVIHGLNQESVDQTDYINGFVYSNNSLELINMSEGRLFKKGDGTFRYDYHLKDHLGNVRCTFTDLDDDDQADIIQEDHFYPFGMSIDGLSYRGDLENNFLYQGKERQPEALDTDDDGTPDKRFLWYDFSARYYDPQLGRWHVSDPANQHYSGYLAMANNPINSIDPDGLFADRLSFLGTVLIGMDAYKKSTWNRTHSHFEWRYDGSLAFIRKGNWVFEAEIPAVDQATSWIDAVGGGMARRALDWRIGEGKLNQFLANADAETKERAQAALDMGGNPSFILAQLEYEMELLMEEAQTGMKGPDGDKNGQNGENWPTADELEKSFAESFEQTVITNYVNDKNYIPSSARNLANGLLYSGNLTSNDYYFGLQPINVKVATFKGTEFVGSQMFSADPYIDNGLPTVLSPGYYTPITINGANNMNYTFVIQYQMRLPF